MNFFTQMAENFSNEVGMEKAFALEVWERRISLVFLGANLINVRE